MGKKGKQPDADLEAIGLQAVLDWSAAIVFDDTLALRLQLGPSHEDRDASRPLAHPKTIQIALSPSQADALAESLLLFLAAAGEQHRPVN